MLTRYFFGTIPTRPDSDHVLVGLSDGVGVVHGGRLRSEIFNSLAVCADA